MSEERSRRLPWGVIATAFAFAWVYAYPVWSAIGNLVALPGYYQAQLGVSSERVPWALLITAVAAPIGIFVLAVLLGWKRGAGAVGLFLVTGFALVSAIALDVIALEKETEIRLVIEFLTRS